MEHVRLLEIHEDTCIKALDIMRRKNNDYCGGKEASAAEALANFKAAKILGLHPVVGLLLRVQDKLMRIKSFVADGELRVANESVEDACDDIVNYAILCKALLIEETETKNHGDHQC
jgi:hypothetical protein|tara:strand:- start:210 stop:560 length:351 start_codon:yes stop_codon:yes gene_type:complete